MRCKVHDLACAPDGLCVVCRREGRVSARPKTPPVVRPSTVWVALGVVGAAMAAGVFYRVRAPAGASLVIAPDTSSRIVTASQALPQAPSRAPAADDGTPRTIATPGARAPETPFAQRLAVFEASAHAAASAAPSSSAPSSSAPSSSAVTSAAGAPSFAGAGSEPKAAAEPQSAVCCPT